MAHDHDHKHSHSPAGAHRAAGPKSVAIQIVTVSDTRTALDDASGELLAGLFRDAGHTLRPTVLVKDHPAEIGHAIDDASRDASVRAIVLNGGTGIAKRDVTIETVTPMLDRVLPGFGEIFRALSFQEIGSAAFLSRAVAGVRGSRVIFALPGSTAAVRLAATKLILPELPHLIEELDK